MQSFSINIPSTDKANIAEAIAAAIETQAQNLEQTVRDHIDELGDVLLAAVEKMQADHVGAAISGTHTAVPDENTAHREQLTLSVFATTPAATESAQAAVASAAPANTDNQTTDQPATTGGLNDSSSGASPIGTALQPANTVPDGSIPVEGTVPTQDSSITNAERTPTVAEAGIQPDAAGTAQGPGHDASIDPTASAGVNSGENPAPATSSDAAASPAGTDTGSAWSDASSASDTAPSTSEAPGSAATPDGGGPGDTSAGASPIGTALQGPNTVPDGSGGTAPGAGQPDTPGGSV